MERLETIEQGLIKGHAPVVLSETRQALDEGVTPHDILDKALIPAMDEVGRLFQNFEYFLPELLVSAKAMEGALEILEPLLVEGGSGRRGVIVLGTVAGDRHDIGKNLVGLLLQGAGFKVHDLGIDVTPEAFVRAVEEHSPQILGLSSMLTTTMPAMGRTIQALEESRPIEGLKVLIGGASVTATFADQIGAHGYAPDAYAAVELVRSMVKE